MELTTESSFAEFFFYLGYKHVNKAYKESVMGIASGSQHEVHLKELKKSYRRLIQKKKRLYQEKERRELEILNYMY